MFLSIFSHSKPSSVQFPKYTTMQHPSIDTLQGTRIIQDGKVRRADVRDFGAASKPHANLEFLHEKVESKPDAVRTFILQGKNILDADFSSCFGGFLRLSERGPSKAWS